MVLHFASTFPLTCQWVYLIVVIHSRLIVFQYAPTTILTKPIEALWVPLVERPWYTLGYRVRLAIGWLCLLAIIFGSAFGFELKDVSTILTSILRLFTDMFPKGAKYTDRVISIAGILIFQTCLWASSKHRSHIPW